jgi:predicted DNA-binding transcriptional regulator AlpA
MSAERKRALAKLARVHDVRRASAPQQLVVDDEGLAALLGVSARTIHRLDSAGRIPQAIALGRCKRWSVDEIRAWIRDGAPRRREWIAMRGNAK